MVRWRELKSLDDELASFGVRSQKLSAERLRAFPEVLWVLYGREHLEYSDAFEAASEHVKRVIQEFIDSLEDQTDQRVAQAFLATTPQFEHKTVEDRERELKNVEQIPPGLYRSRRNVLKREIAAELRRSLHPDPHLQPPLSPKARHAARQLCKYAHETLVYIEAFDHATCSLWAAKQPPNGNRISWYGSLRDHACLDGRTRDSDTSLWLFAHCLRYLQVLQNDSSGRDFLREHMSVSWWSIQLEIPFDTSDILTQLANAEVDQPGPFVDAMCETPQGEYLYRRWVHFLADPPVVLPVEHDHRFPYPVGERNSLRTRLVALCRFLQPSFREDVRPRDLVQREFKKVVSHLLRVGPNAINPSGSDEWVEISRVFRHAIFSRPSDRYLFGEVERGYTEWLAPGSSR